MKLAGRFAWRPSPSARASPCPTSSSSSRTFAARGWCAPYPRSRRRLPSQARGGQHLDDVDPELLRVYEKLGIPLREQEILAGVSSRKVAVDAVFDSVSVVTTFKEELPRPA
jgi:hypothetical protein